MTYLFTNWMMLWLFCRNVAIAEQIELALWRILNVLEIFTSSLDASERPRITGALYLVLLCAVLVHIVVLIRGASLGAQS
jgi:hypothetical protein